MFSFKSLPPSRFPWSLSVRTLGENLWQRHELNSVLFFCDLPRMMNLLLSCASILVCIAACLVLSSTCASTFVKRVLLSSFIVDNARIVAVMLSCDLFVNIPISFLICSTVLSTADSSDAIRCGFLSALPSVSIHALNRWYRRQRSPLSNTAAGPYTSIIAPVFPSLAHHVHSPACPTPAALCWEHVSLWLIFGDGVRIWGNLWLQMFGSDGRSTAGPGISVLMLLTTVHYFLMNSDDERPQRQKKKQIAFEHHRNGCGLFGFCQTMFLGRLVARVRWSMTNVCTSTPWRAVGKSRCASSIYCSLLSTAHDAWRKFSGAHDHKMYSLDALFCCVHVRCRNVTRLQTTCFFMRKSCPFASCCAYSAVGDFFANVVYNLLRVLTTNSPGTLKSPRKSCHQCW